MTSTKDLQKQIDELQSKLAFQDYTIESLNGALASQQEQITQLERMVKVTVDKLKSLQASHLADASEETPPPHY